MDTSDDSPSDTISVDTGDEGSPLYPGTNVSRRETFSDCPNLLLESSVDDNSSSGKLNLIYITFLLMGMGSLLPYNMFINATEYFNYKLRDISSNSTTTVTTQYRALYSVSDYGDDDDDDYESKLQKQFESYFTTFSTSSLLIMVLGTTLLVKCMGSSLRLIGSVVGAMLCFIPSLVMVKLDTNGWQTEFFAATIANIVALNVVSALLQSTSMGIAGVISLKYTQAAMAGQAFAGIFSAVAQILCLAIFEDTENSALLYFLVAEAFLVILLVLSILLLNHPSYLLAQSRVTTPEVSRSADHFASVSIMLGETYHVFKKTLPCGLSLALVFLVTLVIFPNYMVHIEPDKGRYWYPVTVFLLYNLFDFVGRVAAGFIKLPSRTSFIVALSIIRCSFLFIYLFTNYQPRNHYFPVWFESEYLVILFNILLAFSNGYLASICFMYGARYVGPSAHLQEQAGAVLTFFLSLGLCSGSALSFLYIEIP